MTYSKLYVVVRQDLSPGQQIAQAIHAKDKFTHDFPEKEKNWYDNHNTIVILGVSNEKELLRLSSFSKENLISFSIFFEPDISSYTAIAFEPTKLVSLMLKDFKPAGIARGYHD